MNSPSLARYLAFRRSLPPRPPLERITVRARGIDFAVYCTPPVEGAVPLVCVNGGLLFDHKLLWPALAPLATGRQLIFYDQRGRGESGAPPGILASRIEFDGGDVSALRAALGIGEWDLLGHSWGGGIAMLAAAAEGAAASGSGQSRASVSAASVSAASVSAASVSAASVSAASVSAASVSAASVSAASASAASASALPTSAPPAALRRLVLVNAVGVTGDWLPPLHAAGLARLSGAARDRLAAFDPTALAAPELAYHADYAQAFFPAWFADQEFAANVNAPLGTSATGAVVAARLRREGYDWRERLRDVAVPTLVVHGAADVLPLSEAERTAAVLGQAEVVPIAGAGHNPFWEAPDAFFAAVQAFLDGGASPL